MDRKEFLKSLGLITVGAILGTEDRMQFLTYMLRK